MAQCSCKFCLLAEISTKFFGTRKFGTHDLKGDGLIPFDVESIRDNRVRSCRDDFGNAIPVRKHAANQSATCQLAVVDSLSCIEIVGSHNAQNLPSLAHRLAPGTERLCQRCVGALVRHTEEVTDIDATDADQASALLPADEIKQATATPRRRRPDRGLLIASFVIAGGLALIIWGFFTAITGDEGIERPLAIESVSPVENAVQVLQQERIAVDLEFGYEAVLILDGTELETTNIGRLEAQPGEQLVLPPTAIFDPGNAVISFVPNENAAITELTQGLHTARVEYWRLDEGRANAKSYNWTFVVV